jgi:uncharacterized protein (DUF362 family)
MGEDKLAALEEALEAAGFWPTLEEASSRTGAPREDFRILIQPDIGLFESGSSTATDAELVEHLVSLLHHRGWNRAAIGAGRSKSELWLENRDPLVLMDLAGYRFSTAEGRDYEVFDLGEDLAPAPFPEGSALHGRHLARPWIEAHFRISFAKNKTDEELFFALGLLNLLDVLPATQERRARSRLQPADVCTEILRFTPVHFALLDAFESNHGHAGTRRVQPLSTRTLIAAGSLLLCDWVGAFKMGLDPYASPVNAKALREIGLPKAYEIEGDLSPYEGWINVHPLTAESVLRRNESPTVAWTVEPWLQRVDSELFPFKSLLDERVNSWLTRSLSMDGQRDQVPWVEAGLNYLLASASQGVEAASILFDKDRLRWKERPLGLDLALYRVSDFEDVVAYIQPLEDLILRLPPDGQGLRWRYLDRSVLFEHSRVIPVPYEDFVSRVDISKSIRFMNDYIGGTCVPVRRDEAGRVVHQAERNIYLPQPNHLALSGGRMIDVAKLELVSYGDGEQKIFWRTLKSDNDSALFDDGIVTFSRTGEDQTRVRIMGRQQFRLPFLWESVHLDLNPPVKDYLVVQAYTSFLAQTMANFEAAYEGREFRVGRPWGEGMDEDKDGMLGRRLKEVFEKVGEQAIRSRGRIREFLGPQAPRPAAGIKDEDGFVHFRSEEGPAGARTGEDLQRAGRLLRTIGSETLAFFLDLGEAIRKDLGGLSTKDERKQ